MLRGWAHGLLALLFMVMAVQGGLLLRNDFRVSVPNPLGPFLYFMTGQALPASQAPDRGVEVAVSTSRPVGHGKREHDAAGDDPVTLPTLLVVAIALFYALPLRGSDVARALRIGLTPEGRHREAGRCPTGPPAFAG
ncbi:hypothetical protein [Niveispirillum sp.]|uniref:hypothetical protein n=1 Tax=Niveispirillum sp. TaxID=1917217 RepID=UPI001B44B80C|nr:hypothetical protein [Niveispirillum sp.]MBP7336216.1 hypothetical protein [Niveispirillum sp.]